MTIKELNDAVSAVKSGDNSAYEKLYDEFYEPLRFYIAKRIGSVEDAKDLAQDTFVRALEKIGDLKSPEAFKVWLYKIANNITNAYFKESGRYSNYETSEELESVLEQAQEYAEPMYVPHDYLDNKETQREVREAIDSLSPERRSALIMFYYENMKMKDIAATMDINENAVAHRLTEARKQICKRLKAYAGKSFVCVPLPLVLGAIEEQARRDGSTALAVVKTPAPVATGFFRRAVISFTAVAVVGGTVAAQFLLRDGSLGDVRLPDSSASETVSDASETLPYSQTESSAEQSVSGETFSGAAGGSQTQSGTSQSRGGGAAGTGGRQTASDARQTTAQTQRQSGRQTQAPAVTASTAAQGGVQQGSQMARQTSAAAAGSKPASSQAAPTRISPSGFADKQKLIIADSFPRTNLEYSSMLSSYNDDIFDDMFSFLDDGYLPSGGYVFHGSSSGKDASMYVLPIKKVRDVNSGYEYYICGWVSYVNSSLTSVSTNKESPTISTSITSSCPCEMTHYKRNWKTVSGGVVEQAYMVVRLKDYDPSKHYLQYSSFSLSQGSMLYLSSIEQVYSDIPVSEFTDLVGYLNKTEDSYAHLSGTNLSVINAYT